MRQRREVRREFIILTAVLIAVVMFWEELGEIFQLLGDRAEVVALLEGYGRTGPALLAILLVLQVFLAWIPGHVLMVGGGFLYGFLPAFLITAACTIIGSQVAFLLARKAGRPWVSHFVPEKILSKWEKAAARQGALFFLMTFWLPIFPSDVMCFIAGLGKITSRKFFVANLLGRTPTAILLVLVGSHGIYIPSSIWVGLASVVIIFAICWLIGVRYHRYLRPIAI